MVAISLLLLFQAENRRAVLVDEFDDSTTATGDTGQRIIGDNDRQSGFFHQQLVEVAEQCAATS